MEQIKTKTKIILETKIKYKSKLNEIKTITYFIFKTKSSLEHS